MKLVCLALLLLSSPTALTATPKLEETLARVAKYDYDQGREAILDLEEIVRTLPQAEVEQRFVAFLHSPATIAGKDVICRQLSLLGTDRSVPVLARMLLSADTVEMARYALERIPGPAASAALRDALPKAPEKARPGIVNTLGIRRDADAVPQISELVSSSDPHVAASAIAALGRIATPAALPVLEGLRKKGLQPAMEASLVAADRLAAQGERAKALAIFRELSGGSTPPVMRIGGLEGLSRLTGNDAVKDLRAAIRNSDPLVRAAGIRLLAAIPGPQATNALIEELPASRPAARAQLITALAGRRDGAALPRIVAAVKDDAAEVRLAALDALGTAGDASAVALLAELSASENLPEQERTAARNALDRMQGEAVDRAVIAAIATAEPPVKAELIRTAGERGIAEAADTVLAALQDSDRSVRREAFRALRDIAGSLQVPALLDSLRQTNSAADRREFERALAAALRRSPSARSTETVAAYNEAGSAAVRVSLLQVMGQSGANEVLATLLAAARGSNAEEARAAILGLTEWPDDQPMRDLLALAAEAAVPAHRVLALRGFLRLLQLPVPRTASETVPLLATAMKLATQAAEKKTILALLPRFPVPDSLTLAESALQDAEVANEAKLAAERLRRSLRSR